MSRRLAVVFVVWQVLGAFGFLFWEWPKSTALLWVMSFMFLFPGNIVASNLIPDLFWRTRLSVQAISILCLVTAIAINFVLWFAVAWLVRRYRSRTISAVG